MKAHIREDTGLWVVTLEHEGIFYARRAWTRAKAQEIAADLEQMVRERQQ